MLINFSTFLPTALCNWKANINVRTQKNTGKSELKSREKKQIPARLFVIYIVNKVPLCYSDNLNARLKCELDKEEILSLFYCVPLCLD